jgi:hypothetical protein
VVARSPQPALQTGHALFEPDQRPKTVGGRYFQSMILTVCADASPTMRVEDRVNIKGEKPIVAGWIN